MKKCASCTKDLPEAALHCVFCGAKQPPAPAVQPGLAKTAFGYSANEVMDQLGRPNPAPGGPAPYQPPSAPSAPSAPAPYQPPRSNSPSQVPPMGGPMGVPQNLGLRPMAPGVVPASDHQAATVAVPNLAPAHGPPLPQAAPQPMYAPPPAAIQLPAHMQPAAYAPQQPYQPPQQQPYQPPQQQPYQQPQQQGYGAGPMSGGMGINAPNPHTPPPLAPMADRPPHLGAAAGRGSAMVIEPWRDSLKIVMFVWGAVMLVVFATPKSIDPLVFNWSGIGDLPSKMLIMTLLYPALGLLAVVLAALPMPALPRGAFAGALGLAGFVVPLAMGGAPPWQALVGMVGLLALYPGLIVRNEYTDSLLARILVTVGVVCVLVPYLIPNGGELKLVQLFKAVLDAPGKAKVGPLLEVVEVVLVLMSLLVWMPGPATGGGKLFAWAIILWSTAVHDVVGTLLSAPEVGALFKTPAVLVEWGTLAALSMLIAYGVGTVIGKQLE